jgi:thiol-disulfide isomerase/thioredoxin
MINSILNIILYNIYKMDNSLMNKASDFFVNYKNYIIVATVILLVVVFYVVYSKKSDSFVGDEFPGKESFLDNGDKSVDTKGEKKIVLFYAPWCPHCKSMMDGDKSAWQAFSKRNKGRNNLVIDQINCDEKPEVATQYGIGGFPTIILFKDNKTYTYDGDRTLESLEKFVTDN